MSEKILTAYQEWSPCFLRNAAAVVSSLPPVKIVIHTTKAQSTYARSFMDNKGKGMNKPNGEKLPHILIAEGNCGKIFAFQLLPFEWDSDCCGDGELGSYDSGAHRALQIAIAKDRNNSYDYFREAFTLCADICAELCEIYHLSNTDIISHREAYTHQLAERSLLPDIWLERWGYSIHDFRKWVRIRTESDEDILPKEGKRVILPYVVCKGLDEDGDPVEEMSRYADLSDAIRYCPYTFSVYDIYNKKCVYSFVMQVGSRVEVIRNVVCNSIRTFKVEYDVYEVMSIDGVRIVIGINGNKIAAVHRDDLKLLR
ncbi:MAG: N-acetylmuramoyl-L-alanine amidase [Oscillospiraceae bacterium]|nr:N-acetylmuramoyl-L-alanine amidase [Oscillospiraceae bacterium]